MGGTAAITGNATIGGTATIGGNTAITGTLSATQNVTFTGTGQLTIPAGTTGQRSALPTVGMTRYNTTTNVYESYVGIAGQTISSITFITTTATLTTGTAHGLSNGNVVTVSGASPSNYNGTFSITVTGSTTFTYVMATAPSTNATVVGTYTIGAWQTALVNSATAVGQVPFSTDGITFTPTAKIVSGTAVTAATGTPTSIDFTAIPSWVKRITVMLAGVSYNATATPMIQLGTSGGIDSTSNYAGSAVNMVTGTTSESALNTIGFNIGPSSTTSTFYQLTVTLSLVNPSTNQWICAVSGGASNTAAGYAGGGSKTLTGTLDRVRITTLLGTATFDAGTINILYE
jgi:hypothetical protein